jgi:hypothetical protein
LSSRRLLEALLFAGALATAITQAAIAAGASLRGLALALTLGLVAGAGLLVWRRPAPARPLRFGAPEPSRPAPRRAAVASAGVATGVAALLGAPLEWLWVAALLLCASGAVEGLHSPGAAGGACAPSRPHDDPLRGFAVPLLCVLAVAFTAVAHRPDADDAFYWNLAVAAVEHPDARLVFEDTLHGIAGIPIALPVYRVHALEPLVGLIAWLTPASVLDVAHRILPLAAALLIPLVWARLLRRLAPAIWLAALVVALAFTVGFGDAPASPGVFAFVRLHQGKAILAALLLPAVALLALEYALAPDARRFWRLLAIQGVASGASATGLWTAPLVAGFALLAGTPRSRAGWKSAGRGLLASAWPLALGLSVAASARGAFAASATDFSSHADTAAALMRVYGDRLGPALVWFLLSGAWGLAPTALARRFAATSALGALLLLCPWTAGLVGRWVTGEPTYWRVLWLLPAALLVGIDLAAPLRWFTSRGFALGCTLGVALLAALAFGAQPTWAPVHGVYFAAPGYQIPPDEWQAARALAHAVGPEGRVLAPPRVARWLVLIEHHPTPLVVRMLYLGTLEGHLPEREIERRRTLARVVSGQARPADAAARLESAVRSDALDAVLIDDRAAALPGVAEALARAGLVQSRRLAEMQLWTRVGS